MDRTIYVNGVSFTAYTFDSFSTILYRYCLHNEKTIPMYYETSDIDFVIEDGEGIFVEELKYELENNVKNLDNLGFIREMQKYKFKKLPEKEIVLFFLNILNVGITDEVQKKLWEFDKIVFPNKKASSYSLETYIKDIEREREALYRFLRNYDQRASILNRYHPLNSEELFIEETYQGILFHYDTKVSFIDIFDAIIVSEIIPFVYVSINKTLHFKIYKNFPIPEIWNDRDQIRRAVLYPEFLYFKILMDPTKKNSPNLADEDYADASWNVEKGVSMQFNKKVDITKIEKAFFDSVNESLLGRNIAMTYEGIKETGVSTTFKIPNFVIEKIIFSDMICNDDIISFFLFLNEYQHGYDDKALSSTMKNRFMLYFNPEKPGDTKNALSITLNSYEDNQEEYTVVRIGKSDTTRDATKLQKIVCMILSYYQKHYKKYLDIYRQLVPDYVDMISVVKKIKKIKEDQKTGKRLTTLKKEDPYVFRSGYSGFCQPRSRQPYIVPPSDVEKFREKMGENKIMAFPHPTDPSNISYYACEPREEGEERTYIYPGLRKNDSKKNSAYAEEVPYLPCCFSEDQYTKPGSALKKIMESKKKEDYIVESVNEISHVLGFNKQAPVGRYGKIPHYVNFILKQAGYQEIQRGKQLLYPVFRYGVIDTPDSFFHCLERVFTPSYTSHFTAKDRKDLIMKARKKISEDLDALSAGRQECYDYKEKDLVDILMDEKAYIDPGMWLRIAEEHYKCNILLFELSKKYPYGAFLYPRYSKVCIHKDLNMERPTVIISKFEIEEERDWKYQSELFVKFNATKKEMEAKVKFKFETSDPFILRFYENYIRSFYNYFSIDGIQRLKVIPYNSPIWRDVIFQHVDAYGKTRILFYSSGVNVYTFPMHPIAVPIVEEYEGDIKPTSLEDADYHIQEYGLIKHPYKGGWIVQNDHFIGYIKIEEYQVASADDNKIPFCLRETKNSRLSVFNRNKKIAMLLEQHTLFIYSKDPSRFSEDKFVIIKDYVYDEENLSKSLDRYSSLYDQNGKLIVTSREMLDKLLSYLKTRLLNDRYTVLKFHEKTTTVENYYQKIKDFHDSQSQYIILGYVNYENWYKTKNREPYLILSDVDMIDGQPYFYRNGFIKDKKIFIHQNVKDGNMEKALHVSLIWIHKKINLGHDFSFDPYPLEKINYSVYSEKGELLEGNPQEEDSPLLIYKNGRYAALLEL